MEKPGSLAGKHHGACSSACSSSCHPLWIECRGVETAHWARMFAIHSRTNAAAICPQLTATAVICSSPLLPPTDPLEPVETLPPNRRLRARTLQQPSNWSGLKDYRLSQYLCSLPSHAPANLKKKKFLKWTGGKFFFLPTFESENPKTLFALSRMCSSKMPRHDQSMHGKLPQG